MLRANEDIRRDVLEQLQWDNRIKAADLDITVSDGRVRLRGNVPTYTSKRMIVEDAFLVDGVRGVQDEMEVVFPPGFSAPAEVEISANIRQALERSPDISEENIQVDTQGGVVTLSGTVPNIWQRQKTEMLAEDITGVATIDNKIQVSPAEQRPDQEIGDRIRAAMKRQRALDEENITVTVENGVAYLSGKVPHWDAYEAAERVAGYTEGVRDVTNTLEVGE